MNTSQLSTANSSSGTQIALPDLDIRGSQSYVASDTVVLMGLFFSLLYVLRKQLRVVFYACDYRRWIRIRGQQFDDLYYSYLDMITVYIVDTIAICLFVAMYLDVLGIRQPFTGGARAAMCRFILCLLASGSSAYYTKPLPGDGVGYTCGCYTCTCCQPSLDVGRLLLGFEIAAAVLTISDIISQIYQHLPCYVICIIPVSYTIIMASGAALTFAWVKQTILRIDQRELRMPLSAHPMPTGVTPTEGKRSTLLDVLGTSALWMFAVVMTGSVMKLQVTTRSIPVDNEYSFIQDESDIHLFVFTFFAVLYILLESIMFWKLGYGSIPRSQFVQAGSARPGPPVRFHELGTELDNANNNNTAARKNSSESENGDSDRENDTKDSNAVDVKEPTEPSGAAAVVASPTLESQQQQQQQQPAPSLVIKIVPPTNTRQPASNDPSVADPSLHDVSLADLRRSSTVVSPPLHPHPPTSASASAVAAVAS